jgi:hypothetical protein
MNGVREKRLMNNRDSNDTFII